MHTTARRAARAIALPAATLLLLTACGSSDDSSAPDTSTETTAADATTPAQSDAGGEDSWPIVEDEDGNPVENPEDEPGPAGEDTTMTEVPDWGATGEAVTITNEGALLTVTLEAEAPADIEELRESVGQEPITYITVEIDNTEGYDTTDVLGLDIVGADGTEHEYLPASEVYTEWGGTMRDDGPNEDDPYWYSDAEGNEIPEEQYNALSETITELDDTYWDTQTLPTATSTATLIGPELPAEITYAQVVGIGMETYPLIPTGN